MTTKKETGNKGEQLGRQYLEQLGYQILDINWRSRRYELDIVALDGDTLVIVEVKTRTSSLYGEPYDAVNHRKTRHLISAAESYIRQKQLDRETRFDVISVVFDGEKPRLEHIKDAFYPTAR